MTEIFNPAQLIMIVVTLIEGFDCFGLKSYWQGY